MLGPNGEFHWWFLRYRLGGGYTKINTGFSGSNIMGEKRPQRETSKTRAEDETETSGCEGKQNGILGQYKGVIVLILVV